MKYNKKESERAAYMTRYEIKQACTTFQTCYEKKIIHIMISTLGLNPLY